MGNAREENHAQALVQLQIPKKNICDGMKHAYWPARLEKINHGKLDLLEYFNVDEPVFIGQKEIKDFSPSEIPLQAKDILKESSNRGAILIRRKLDCQKEYKSDLDNLGLLKPVEIGFGLISTNPIINNFRGH